MTAEEMMSVIQKRLIADGLGFYRTSDPLVISVASFREQKVSVIVRPGLPDDTDSPFVTVYYFSPPVSAEVYELRNCDDIPSMLVSVLNMLLLKHGLFIKEAL